MSIGGCTGLGDYMIRNYYGPQNTLSLASNKKGKDLSLPVEETNHHLTLPSKDNPPVFELKATFDKESHTSYSFVYGKHIRKQFLNECVPYFFNQKDSNTKLISENPHYSPKEGDLFVLVKVTGDQIPKEIPETFYLATHWIQESVDEKIPLTFSYTDPNNRQHNIRLSFNYPDSVKSVIAELEKINFTNDQVHDFTAPSLKIHQDADRQKIIMQYFSDEAEKMMIDDKGNPLSNSNFKDDLISTINSVSIHSFKVMDWRTCKTCTNCSFTYRHAEKAFISLNKKTGQLGILIKHKKAPNKDKDNHSPLEEIRIYQIPKNPGTTISKIKVNKYEDEGKDEIPYLQLIYQETIEKN